MARRLEVEIIGDSRSLEGALGRSGAATGTFGGALKKLAGMALLGTTAVGVGLVYALDKSVKAAMDAQASQAALDAALRATHQSVEGMTPALDAAEASARKLGFADDESRQALARLEIAAGNTKKAIEDMGVAEDIARLKHIDLAGGATMLAMAMTGSQRAAKQLGISVSPVTTNLDELKASTMDLTTAAGHAAAAHAKLRDKMLTGKAVIEAVTEKVHGQAQAFADTAAGGMAQFEAQTRHIEEALGSTLLPTIANVAGAFADFIGKIAAADGMKAKILVVLEGLEDVGKKLDAFLFGTTIHIRGMDFGGMETVQTQGLVDKIGAAMEHVDWAGVGLALARGIKRGTDYASAESDTAGQNFGQRVMHGIGKAIDNPISLLGIGLSVAKVGLFIADELDKILGIGPRFAAALIRAIEDGIGHGVGVAAAAAGRVGLAIVDGLRDKLGGLLGMIHTKLSEVGAAIRGWVSSARAYAFSIGSAIAEGVISGIGNLAGRVIDKVGGAIHGGLSFLHQHMGSTIEEYAAAELGAPIIAGVIQGIEDSMPGLTFTLKDSIVAAGQSASSAAIEAGSTLGEQLVGGLVDGVQRLQGMVNDMMAAVVDAALASSLAEVVRAAQRGVGAISGVGASHPSVGIMGLQSGGIVTRPTLALVGEHGPEAVVPLGAGGGFGGDTYVFQFPNYLGSKDDLINTIKGGFAKKKFRGGL